MVLAMFFASAGWAQSDIISEIDVAGNRRIPKETILARIFTHPGDVYDPAALERDFNALWNTGYFQDIRFSREETPKGWRMTITVKEKPTIRDINYVGLSSVSTSDVLDRFKEAKVGLTVENQYDPTKVKKAEVAIKGLLAEHGRQFSTIRTEIRDIPPAAVGITFVIKEGPKVKVGKIKFEGNKNVKTRVLRYAMKNLRPIGIPHSIFLEDLFARTYDATKLDEDTERVRNEYQNRGYFKVIVNEPQTQIHDTGHKGPRIPLLQAGPGKAVDITLPIEEGDRYALGGITFKNNKAVTNVKALRGLFPIKDGDIFSKEKIAKGLENMRKAYGERGYINFTSVPETRFDDEKKQIFLDVDVDEGKQFFVRRIDFTGNTTTRDKVIRREILIDEGDVYNSTLWDASILRLNQIGYFEVLKENESYELRRNAGTNTVDILLKVKERGKNSISLNGGVSGVSGTFIGLNYSTNNFLGLGDTLTLQSQVGTLQDRITLGFTQPYLFDRPLQAGISFYYSRFSYNQGQQQSLLTGTSLQSFYNSLGSANVLNYVQDSKGVTLSASYPIKRSFARLGLSLGYDISTIKPESAGATTYFTYINFLGVNGPNTLTGIKTLSITPSYSYNSKNSFQNPTAGRSIFFSIRAAGSVLGANVNIIQPTFDGQYFHISPRWHKNVMAFHLTGTTVTGYGGKEIPPFLRGYIGGENDVRGYEFYSITPIGFIPNSAVINQLNPDGSQRTQNIIEYGVKVPANVTLPIPTYQIVTPGGDTHGVFNFEYRIPIVGPITLVPFFDAGINRIMYPGQLTVNPGQITNLDNQFPQAAFNNKVVIAPGTQDLATSTGLEIDVILPVVQAPFRVYYAFNPNAVREYIQPPIVVDRSTFPNAATFNSAVETYGTAYPYFEKRGTFRFTVGRTF